MPFSFSAHVHIKQSPVVLAPRMAVNPFLEHRWRPLYTVRVGLLPQPSFSDSLKTDQRRHFYERHKPVAVALIVIVFVAPILGVLLNGLAGLFWGMTVSVLGYYLTPYVVMKLREVLGGE